MIPKRKQLLTKAMICLLHGMNRTAIEFINKIIEIEEKDADISTR
jgi:hypothetical protein